MTSHECPSPHCQEQVPHHQLCCRKHWFALPAEIRARVWKYWRAGDHAHHQIAVRDAISYLEARYAHTSAA